MTEKVVYWTERGMVEPTVSPTDGSGFVRHSDYARLAARVEELEADKELLEATLYPLQFVEAERDRLREAAGDAIASAERGEGTADIVQPLHEALRARGAR